MGAQPLDMDVKQRIKIESVAVLVLVLTAGTTSGCDSPCRGRWAASARTVDQSQPIREVETTTSSNQTRLVGDYSSIRAVTERA